MLSRGEKKIEEKDINQRLEELKKNKKEIEQYCDQKIEPFITLPNGTIVEPQFTTEEALLEKPMKK